MKRRGQNTLEYVMVISIVAVALISMVSLFTRFASFRVQNIGNYVAEERERLVDK